MSDPPADIARQRFDQPACHLCEVETLREVGEIGALRSFDDDVHGEPQIDAQRVPGVGRANGVDGGAQFAFRCVHAAFTGVDPASIRGGQHEPGHRAPQAAVGEQRVGHLAGLLEVFADDQRLEALAQRP